MKTPYVFFLSEEKLTRLGEEISSAAFLVPSGVTDFFLKIYYMIR